MQQRPTKDRPCLKQGGRQGLTPEVVLTSIHACTHVRTHRQEKGNIASKAEVFQNITAGLLGAEIMTWRFIIIIWEQLPHKVAEGKNKSPQSIQLVMGNSSDVS